MPLTTTAIIFDQVHLGKTSRNIACCGLKPCRFTFLHVWNAKNLTLYVQTNLRSKWLQGHTFWTTRPSWLLKSTFCLFFMLLPSLLYLFNYTIFTIFLQYILLSVTYFLLSATYFFCYQSRTFVGGHVSENTLNVDIIMFLMLNIIK